MSNLRWGIPIPNIFSFLSSGKINSYARSILSTRNSLSASIYANRGVITGRYFILVFFRALPHLMGKPNCVHIQITADSDEFSQYGTIVKKYRLPDLVDWEHDFAWNVGYVKYR